MITINIYKCYNNNLYTLLIFVFVNQPKQSTCFIVYNFFFVKWDWIKYKYNALWYWFATLYLKWLKVRVLIRYVFYLYQNELTKYPYNVIIFNQNLISTFFVNG